jgi:putative DNA primase/helicase
MKTTPKIRAVPVPRGYHRGHLGMAERFVTEHAEQLRHVHGIGWHNWDGARWELDDERVDIEAAIATTKRALADVLDMEKGPERDNLYKDVRKAESSSGIEGMLKLAGALKPISASSRALDADPYLFNTPAGTVDLHEGTVKENDRDDMITKVAGGGIADELSEEWEGFLKRILPDEDVRAFVQRLFGYAMLGKQTEHVMPIFTGTGANGKGTMRDALVAAFGDYAIEVDPQLLMESKHERHGAFKMRLRGARLAFCSETEKGRKFNEAAMKRLVGGDPIEANYMHKNPITFDPSHTLIMLTNHLPAVSGDDPAVWRRILVVPFDVTIPEEERDGGLPERLKLAAPAVLAWAYQGWLDYQEQGLNPPDAVRARELYSTWTKWCHDNGIRAEEVGSEVAFAASMKARGYEKKSRNVGAVWIGLILAGDDEDENA